MTGVDRRLALGRAWALVRRGRWLVVLVAAVLAVGWLRFWRPVAVEVATVERAPVVREAFGRGTIESQREAAVGFDLVGRLQRGPGR
jgi:multidrug efflux pump subunit AcrA (membrane-fusion protein)